MSQRRLVEALRGEVEAARSASRFETERADRAEIRVKELHHELERTQRQLREALQAPASTGSEVPTGELAQRLKLALDSNQRLEKARGKHERDALKLAMELKECREVARRWEQRARALEGRLKLLG